MPQRKKLRYYNKHLYGGTDDLCPICLEELNEDDDTLECDSAGCRFRCHSHCLEELCRAREPYRRVCPYCKNPNICDQLDNTSIINIVENLYNENLRRFRNEIDVLLRHDVVRVELGYRSPGVIYSILSPNNVATGIDEMLFHNAVDDTPEEQLLEWLNTHFDKYKTTAFSIDGRDTERLSLEIRERYENLEQIKQETIDLKILWFFVDISTEKYISHLQNLYDHLFTVFREYKPIVERNLSYRLPPTITIDEQYNTLKKVAKDIYYFRTILIKREDYVNLTNASNIRTHYRDGDITTAMGLARGAIQSYNSDRALENALRNIQFNALNEVREQEPEPDPQEIIGGSDMQNGGAGYGFTGKLHKLLTNQEYSNIISWTFDNDGNILILLKDKLLVAKEVCPRSANIDFHSCARQFCNYGFKTETRLSIEGIDKNNGLIFSNPKVKSIDDILTLERKISTKCRKSPTIDDGDRAANVLAQLNNPSTDRVINAMEAANVLAGIANINDENTEERVSYLQNLELNSRNSLNIALLIEALLKNDVVDENEKNQIKQKQKELWQYLKEIPLEDNQRRDILFKYMFEYLTRTIPLAKLHKAGQIAKGINDSIKRAQIHNRPTEPLTESEQKQADEEMNAAISRGSQLAVHEPPILEGSQSYVDEYHWWRKGGITDKALLRLHSEPVDGHMIEVYWGNPREDNNNWAFNPTPYKSHWKLGRAVRKNFRSKGILKPPAGEAETIRQIVTQVDYIDGTSVDELLHRGEWKQRVNPKEIDPYHFPKYWRYAKSNSRSQSGGVIYVDDE